MTVLLLWLCCGSASCPSAVALLCFCCGLLCFYSGSSVAQLHFCPGSADYSFFDKAMECIEDMNHWHNLKPLLNELTEKRQRWQFWLIRLFSQITIHRAFCTGLRKNPYALWERDHWTITMWAYRSSLNAMPVLPLCKQQDNCNISFFQQLGSVKFSPDCSVI